MSRYKGKVVFSDEDEVGAIDVVEDGPQLRSLQFGSEAKQSTMFLHDPAALALAYTQCMMTTLLFGRPPGKVLVLGLGGGSLPKFLLHTFPECRIDAVEKREKIAAVARRFFALPEDPRLSITVGDGFEFLENRDPVRDYDLIPVDLHDSHGMAPVVRRADFFPACRRHLAKAGTLVINLWYGGDEGSERQVRGHLELTLSAGVLYLPVAGKRNCVGLAFEGWFVETREELENRARAWQRRTGIRFTELLRELIRFNPGAL